MFFCKGQRPRQASIEEPQMPPAAAERLADFDSSCHAELVQPLLSCEPKIPGLKNKSLRKRKNETCRFCRRLSFWAIALWVARERQKIDAHATFCWEASFCIKNFQPCSLFLFCLGSTSWISQFHTMNQPQAPGLLHCHDLKMGTLSPRLDLLPLAHSFLNEKALQQAGHQLWRSLWNSSLSPSQLASVFSCPSTWSLPTSTFKWVSFEWTECI